MDTSYDDKNLLAIGFAFIANLIFLNTIEDAFILDRIFLIFSLSGQEIIKNGIVLILTFIGIILLIFALIITINIILNSEEIFNKLVSVGTIIVIFIIAFYGLNYSIRGFKILFLSLFFIGLFFKVWEDVKNSD